MQALVSLTCSIPRQLRPPSPSPSIIPMSTLQSLSVTCPQLRLRTQTREAQGGGAKLLGLHAQCALAGPRRERGWRGGGPAQRCTMSLAMARAPSAASHAARAASCACEALRLRDDPASLAPPTPPHAPSAALPPPLASRAQPPSSCARLRLPWECVPSGSQRDAAPEGGASPIILPPSAPPCHSHAAGSSRPLRLPDTNSDEKSADGPGPASNPSISCGSPGSLSTSSSSTAWPAKTALGSAPLGASQCSDPTVSSATGAGMPIDDGWWVKAAPSGE
mmetsp:Transcript_48839/g.116027  ORF Transcript_48839/g.116027 Transcript_48839/m.116027 type:complete len:278 (-) Transcript_48839:365-1198(-)